MTLKFLSYLVSSITASVGIGLLISSQIKSPNKTISKKKWKKIPEHIFDLRNEIINAIKIEFSKQNPNIIEAIKNINWDNETLKDNYLKNKLKKLIKEKTSDFENIKLKIQALNSSNSRDLEIKISEIKNLLGKDLVESLNEIFWAIIGIEHAELKKDQTSKGIWFLITSNEDLNISEKNKNCSFNLNSENNKSQCEIYSIGIEKPDSIYFTVKNIQQTDALKNKFKNFINYEDIKRKFSNSSFFEHFSLLQEVKEEISAIKDVSNLTKHLTENENQLKAKNEHKNDHLNLVKYNNQDLFGNDFLSTILKHQNFFYRWFTDSNEKFTLKIFDKNSNSEKSLNSVPVTPIITHGVVFNIKILKEEISLLSYII